MKRVYYICMLLAVLLLCPHGIYAQVKNTKDKIEQPEYPGGLNALYKFISSEVVYPSDAREKEETGEVLVGFTVGIDGHLTGIRVLKSVSESLDKEAIRVIEKTGYWYPGKKNGKPVRFEMSIPINFKMLMNSGKYINED